MSDIVPSAETKLDIAMQYVRRGWKIFMLGAGKTPLPNCPRCATAGPDHNKEDCDCIVCHGFYAATDRQERLELMLMLHPDGLWAVRCGPPSGIAVIDAENDPERDGLGTLDDWEQWVGGWSLPDTLMARSGSGGLHRFYEYVPGTKSRNSVLPGVDVKADKGYVALPSGDGNRVWLNELPIATPPGELAAWFVAARGHSTGVGGAAGEGYDYQKFVREGCPDGHRDFFFNDMCYRLRKSDASKSTAAEELRRHWERAEQPPQARYPMPWEHVLYKLERVWREVEPDPDVPRWDPTGATQGTTTFAAAYVNDTEHKSDTGNAHRLVRLIGDDVRYAPEMERWLIWDGNRWVPDVLNQMLAKTLLVVDDIRRQVDSVQDAEQQRQLAAHALLSESLARRKAMVATAEAHPKIAITVDRLDSDPWLLVVRNGTLDLRTNELRPSAREDLNTRCAAVDYIPEAECPRWREHVKLVTGADPVLANYLRRAVGYSLTGVVSEQAFFMLEGDGANGKNAFIEPILAMLGGYAQTGTSALLTGGDEQHPTIIADLVGARLVFIDESRQGRPLNVERVKQLTGSRTIKARKMGKDFFEFAARLKLWIAGNNHPTLRDPSDGVWRRLHRVLFTAKIPADRIVRDYGDLLYHEEASGILNWALEGLSSWRDLGGLGQPPSVSSATEELKDEEDYVAQFLAERIVVTHDAEHRITNQELYQEFCIWSTLSGLAQHERPNRTHFGRLLAAKGFPRWKSTIGGVQHRGFTGLYVYRT